MEMGERDVQGDQKVLSGDKDLQERYERRSGALRFPLGRIAVVLRLASLSQPIIPLLKVVLSFFVPLYQNLPDLLSGAIEDLTEKLTVFLRSRTRWLVIGYLMEIANYTSPHEKPGNFRLRQEILKECQSLLEAILNDEGYQCVVIAGHSLGSVIAYDTLNRVNIAVNFKSGKAIPYHKIAGLITFGSPLDKIAFYFREHTAQAQSLLRQINEHLHSFKAKQLDTLRSEFPLSDPIEDKLAGVPWVNYFSTKDPIRGHIDLFEIPQEDNVHLELKESWGVAHIGYWTHEPFYADIVRRFLSPK